MYGNSEGQEDRLIRLLREEQQTLINKIARGNVELVDSAGGYWALTGRVVQLDRDIALVEECLFGKAPPPPPEFDDPIDRYGVR